MVTTNETGLTGANPMKRRPGYLLRRAHQLHDALWSATVSQDTTPTQFAVLSVIAGHSPCDQATVAREASLDTSTAGAVVQRLVDRGWVRTETSPVDRRRNILRLTPAGQGHHDRISHAAAEMTAHLVSPLSTQEQARLTSLLEQLIAAHERAS